MMEKIEQTLKKVDEILVKPIAKNDSFFDGELGLIYYFYNKYLMLGDSKLLGIVEKKLTELFERVKDGSQYLDGPSLSYGLAGLAFVLRYIKKNGHLKIDTEAVCDIDEYLYSEALQQLATDQVDLLHFAGSIINYFGYQDRRGDKYQALIKKLLDKAVRAKNEACWVTHFDGIENEINLSLSHGNCGILLLLLEALPCYKDQHLLRTVIWEGLQFIKNQQVEIDDIYQSVFPSSIDITTRKTLHKNRIAWCYGDLGITLLFTKASLHFKSDDLINTADRTGKLTAARRDTAQTLVMDSHFCHGAGGVSMIYRNLLEMTSSQVYHQAQAFWQQRTIELLAEDLLNNTFENEHSLLNGLPGAALAVISGLTPHKIRWGSVFFV